MPLYQYVCEKCNHEFRKLVHREDSVHCPECEAEEVVKQLSLPARTSTESSLPSGCDTSLPPCSPTCCRLPQK